MVEQQRCAVIQPVKICCAFVVAQNFAAKVTFNRKLRGERKLISALLNLIKGCSFAALVVLALKPTQGRDLGQRRETMTHLGVSWLVLTIFLAVNGN